MYMSCTWTCTCAMHGRIDWRCEGQGVRPQAHAGFRRGRKMHKQRGDEQAAHVGPYHVASSSREVLPRIILPRRRWTRWRRATRPENPRVELAHVGQERSRGRE